MTHLIPGADLSHPPKKRFHGQALYEDRKSDDSKADGNDFFALRDFQREGQGPAGTAPRKPRQNRTF